MANREKYKPSDQVLTDRISYFLRIEDDLNKDRIIELVKQSDSLAEVTLDFEINFAIAFLHGSKNKFKKAIHYALRSTELAESLDNEAILAKALFIQGTTLFHLNRIEGAIKVFYRGLELRESKYHFRILLLLAGIYMDINDLIRAGEYLEKAAALKDRTEKVLFIDYHLNMINFHMLNAAYEKARLHGMQAIRFCKEKNARHKLGAAYNAMGHLCYDMGLFDEAIDFATKGKDICQELRLEARIGEADYILAECYEKTGQDEKAIVFFEKACKNARKNRLHLWFNCYEGRFRMYDKLGDHARMKSLIEEMLTLEDEFFKYENTSRLRDLVDEQSRKIHQLEEHRAEIERQNQILVQKNYELREFAYIVSHDLRQPLRNMSSFLNLLEKKFLNGSEKELALSAQRVQFSANRLFELLRTLHAFVSLNKYKPYEKAIKPEEQLAEAISITKKQHPDIEVNVRWDAPVSFVGNPRLITILFEHLLEFTVQRRISDSVEIAIQSTAIEDDQIQFIYTDNGKQWNLDKNADLFQLSGDIQEESHDSSSLALAVCQKVVHLYQGNLVNDRHGKHHQLLFDLKCPSVEMNPTEILI